MDTERTANINIGGEEFTLLLTTRATKEIAARYGGLENLVMPSPLVARLVAGMPNFTRYSQK